MAQLRIAAVYMRGGASKGVFFLAKDLPADPAARDPILLRVTGSPDPYGRQIDGMGGGVLSTSKVVLISRSERSDSDVDYLFGAVSIERPVIDWSANCGNLTAAVGPFAVSAGLVEAPAEGTAQVRIWQANIGKRIIAHVPMAGGEVQEEGEFELDGVTFPAAEVKLEFLDPGGDEGAAGGGMFPTGRPLDLIAAPGVGAVEATLIDSGIPMIFVGAADLGMTGADEPAAVNGDADLLARAEALRAAGAVAMGLAADPDEASARRPHSPKLAVVAAPAGYAAADGRTIERGAIDLLVRTFSMGKLHHAVPGASAVAVATAAAIPGTLVERIVGPRPDGAVRIGHPSGTMSLAAEARQVGGQWGVEKVVVSRSARRLMEGWARIPPP